MFIKEIGLHAQKIITILNASYATVNIIGRLV